MKRKWLITRALSPVNLEEVLNNLQERGHVIFQVICTRGVIEDTKAWNTSFEVISYFTSE